MYRCTQTKKEILLICGHLRSSVLIIRFQMRPSTWILTAVFFFARFANIARAADELNLFAWSEYCPK